MEGVRLRLLRCLDSGGFRTGTEMGGALGMSRAAVHKHIQALVAQGVPIHRVPGRGYRLADGVSLLDENVIRDGLSQRASSLLAALEVLPEVDSTSAHLARSGRGSPLNGRVCLAEKQTSGRGRRGRTWASTPYRNLTMSVGLEYPQWPADLPTLGLVAAVVLVRALASLGVQDLALKWPNDLVHQQRKLCGVLLDVTGEAHGDCRVVIGIGINVSIGDEQARAIDQQWTDVRTVIGRPLDRNLLAARCLDVLLPAFEAFPSKGFAAYRDEWEKLDALRGRPVTVRSADGGGLDGTGAGIDPSGRLRVVDAVGGLHLFTQGDVSVRLK